MNLIINLIDARGENDMNINIPTRKTKQPAKSQHDCQPIDMRRMSQEMASMAYDNWYEHINGDCNLCRNYPHHLDHHVCPMAMHLATVYHQQVQLAEEWNR